VSLVQGAVQIHRHDVDVDMQWPSIATIANTVEHTIDEATDLVHDATNVVVADPLVRVLGAFHKTLNRLDLEVNRMWMAANLSTDDVVSMMDRVLNVSTDGVTDSAAVNMVLNKAVQMIERVTVAWTTIALSIETIANSVQNQLSTVGFKDLAASLSEFLAKAMDPFHKTAGKLLEVKRDLQRGAQPWTTNAETDKPVQEAIDNLKEAFDEVSSKKNLLLDWFQRIVDKIDEVSKILGGDQYAKIVAAMTPLSPDLERLLEDLTGGLSSFTAKLEEELGRVRAITEPAAAAQSAAMEPRSLSMAVGALALVALAPVLA